MAAAKTGPVVLPMAFLLVAEAQNGSSQFGGFGWFVDTLDKFEKVRRHLDSEAFAANDVAAGHPRAADLLRGVDEMELQPKAGRLGDLAHAVAVGDAHQ